MSAMDYHYETVGRVLAHLVNVGLKRIDLEPSDAMDIMTERHGDEEEVIETFADVVKWMHDEGLIRIHAIQEFDGGFAFDGVQLSAKGIAVIQTKPDDAALGESIEKRVSTDTGGDLDASLYTKIGAFVGGLIGGVSQSLGG